MDPIFTIKSFVNSLKIQKPSLLLALSGGADSLCLFYSLLEYKKNDDFFLHVAHVDHGWREESSKEAELLEKLVQSYEIPFHKKVLDPSTLKGNLENACREARYQFFKEIADQFNFHGVLTAHHADDQSETVLKRLFEGSHWSRLSGLQPVIELNGLKVWRPFLNLPKKKLLQWLESRGYSHFEDKTNKDLKFLRSRMREKILPELRATFGKEIVPSLMNLAEDIADLDRYFQKKLVPLLETIHHEAGSEILHLGELPSLDLVEMKYLIRKWFDLSEVSFSRQQIQQIAECVIEKKHPKVFLTGSHKVEVGKYSLKLVHVQDIQDTGPGLTGPTGHARQGQKADIRKACLHLPRLIQSNTAD